ncbi:asparagine--tRNA ligase [Candidatus Falkowbacteria bacterium RIFOXYB2_FULL_38_15]|uniref:Asparagine--tRNA ligase n=1 Tax=Candidatus Falkowbacteria bacterium RIFOXYA2_FULL_38_12 TaxID=1797993 RepID=A0A1F5S2V0_9BACT|nr:MAG: asparagine--tRNA ligase [Candidatus Falkowbacteria bacterium RIFOXYA2_FULL_38_12]OGF33153.1 MAG: asparagine--tRNA ligase [Candidatus Falkowbacteria bacterium RIFOXYB2_FULL_38_15]OGF43844.1 MAG: asparagine--tRNA ligase [Candidatus Falkowbacteria bacterium RIFOXYD2_FULL_39_16]
MEKVLLKDISAYLDQEITLRGWVFNLRSSGSIAFLQLRDGSGFIQAIVSKKEVSPEIWGLCEKITIETSVELTGKVSKHPKKEEYELQVKNINLIQIAEEYPIGKKEHGPDFLLDQRHLWLRSGKQWAALRIRNTVINATYEYFNQNGFIKIDTPILTPTACEGTTTLFEVPYFDLGKAYLSQSGQLYLEAAIFSFGRCFDFGPTFRAEKSKTRRHLTEFWMMDAEAAFVHHEENMKIQEELICHVVKRVLENNKKELEILERDTSKLEKIKEPFIRMTYHDAIKKAQSLGSDIKDGDDLGADDETLLTQDLDVPVFVEKWPKEIKAFYMKRDEANPNLVLGADLIATEGHGEIIGGSEREDNYEVLLQRMKEEKMPLEDFEWYLDLRKYGSVPHSGFGYGLERLTGWMCGIHHIRETIPFPRMINRLRP